MSTINFVNSASTGAYPSPVNSPKPGSAPQSATGSSVPVDQVDISHPDGATHRQTSETGRIALNLAAGNLTSDQATQLYQQVSSIAAQITADKAANGGTLSSQDAQSINQLQTQLSGSIYSDAHNGATPPSTAPSVSPDVKREAEQAGRIQLNLQAGKLSTTQAQQLSQQQAQIDQQIAADKQANAGSPLTQAQDQQIRQLQNQASKDIYQAVHHITPSGL